MSNDILCTMKHDAMMSISRIHAMTQKWLTDDDARQTVVALADAGEALRDKFESISRRLVRLVYSPLEKDEAEIFEGILGKILANLKTTTERKNK